MIDMLLIENPNYRVLLLLDEFVWLLFSFFPDNFYVCVVRAGCGISKGRPFEDNDFRSSCFW
jgi:hypothetical protein